MLTILVIEDDWSVGALYEAIILKLGHKLLQDKFFPDGMKALRAGIMQRPDAIIADHHLSIDSVTGTEVCDRVRRFLDIPVLLSTGSNLGQHRIKLYGKASVDYIKKPFRMDQIVDWLNKVEGENENTI